MPEHDDLQAVQELNEAYRLITEQLGRVIVGQQQVIEELLVAMFAPRALPVGRRARAGQKR